MGRVIAIVNQKGGVGKTTTAVNLSAGLAMNDRSTLMIDMDPQCSGTSGYGVHLTPNQASTYDVLLGAATAERAMRRTMLPRLQLIGASQDLVGAEIELVSVERREFQLRDALATLRYRYDFIIMDCPPSLGLVTLNALTACDALLIPLQCEYYALEGLSALLSTVGLVRDNLNPDLAIDGLILTMFDGRNGLCRAVAGDVKTHFPDKVFDAVIPRNVRLSESPSYSLPALLYAPKSKGALAYTALSQELITRTEALLAEKPAVAEKVPEIQEETVPTPAPVEPVAVESPPVEAPISAAPDSPQEADSPREVDPPREAGAAAGAGADGGGHAPRSAATPDVP